MDICKYYGSFGQKMLLNGVLMDLLRLCSEDRIAFVQKFVQLMLESRFEEKTDDK